MRKLMRVLAGLACVVVCVVVIARLGAKFELLGTGTDPSWWGIVWKAFVAWCLFSIARGSGSDEEDSGSESEEAAGE